MTGTPASPVEQIMQEIVQKLFPEVVKLYATEQSGEFAIRFSMGRLKQVVQKEVTL